MPPFPALPRLLAPAVSLALAACALAGCSTASTVTAAPAQDAGSAPDATLAEDGSAGAASDAGSSLGDGANAPPSDASSVGTIDAPSVIPPPLSSTCSQSLADGTTPPATTAFIYPAKRVTPFYQWINNNGYCGEVSMIQAGMNNGQWASQYNARLLCGGQANGSDGPVGAPLLQSGPDASCDTNAQLLLDTGSSDSASTCLSNFGLAGQLFDYGAEPSGTAGFQSFLAWVKARTIAGDNVTIGILDSNGNDSEYDHIVSVVKIGTNHATTDATYYDDDVLYFDDHGLLTFEDGGDTGNPAIPPGTGSDTSGCTPYVFGYSFGTLGQTAAAAHASGAKAYAIVIPGTSTHNYGFAVSGPLVADGGAELLPVILAIYTSSTGGAANPDSPLVGFNYEAPHIGAKDDGTSCTNATPSSWMTIGFEVTVSGLTAGTSYNLYEYDFPNVSGIGSAAALAIPTENFNAHASQASATVTFTATGPTFTYVVPPRTTDRTIAFRAVAAGGP
jgi:hypothetical protein